MKRKILAIGFVLALLLAFGVSRLSAESVLTLEGLATAVTRLTITQKALDSRVSALESQLFHGDAYTSAQDAIPTHDLLQRLYTLRVVTFAESENEGRSTLKVSYVETDQRAINARIRDVTKEFIDEYREYAAKHEAGYQEELKESGVAPFSFVTHYDQSLDFAVVNGNIISFSVEQSRHTGGTGNTSTVGYIFNLQTGQELPIAGLFVDDSYLERLSGLSRDILEQRLGDPDAEGLFDSGTTPEPESFDTILFRDGGLVVLRFDKYQVGSGAEGVVEVFLYISDLEDILRPEIRQFLGIEEDEN